MNLEEITHSIAVDLQNGRLYAKGYDGVFYFVETPNTGDDRLDAVQYYANVVRGVDPVYASWKLREWLESRLPESPS